MEWILTFSSQHDDVPWHKWLKLVEAAIDNPFRNDPVFSGKARRIFHEEVLKPIVVAHENFSRAQSIRLVLNVTTIDKHHCMHRCGLVQEYVERCCALFVPWCIVNDMIFEPSSNEVGWLIKLCIR